MARPKKNTADYFPHLCNHGKKMSYIERRHGNDGYATWYKVLEKLAQAHDHYLYLQDDVEADFLADYCMIDVEKLTEIIADLVKVGALDGTAWEHKIIYSCTLIESLGDLYARRKDKPAELMQIIRQVSGVNVDINPHSIVKYSKEKESIVVEAPLSSPNPEKCHVDHMTDIYGILSPVQVQEIIPIFSKCPDIERFGEVAKKIYKETQAKFRGKPLWLCQKVFAEMQKPVVDYEKSLI